MAKGHKGNKRSMNPADLTPEYIAEQRALREERKKKKLEEALARGEIPESEKKEPTKFLTREYVSVDDNEGVSDHKFSVMTYNTLGQTLIRRKLFPENGDALKWKWRSTILKNEILHYSPQVLVCQEVDVEKEGWWTEFLTQAGYKAVFSTYEGKNHGLMCAWKTQNFQYESHRTIEYDHETIGDLPVQFKTRNTGLMVQLKHVVTGQTIVFGTTHLFWHPMGSFERTKQTAMLLRACGGFVDHLAQETGKKPILVVAGDFNSTPWDGPYIGATEQTFDELTRPILSASLQYKFTRKSKEQKAAEAAKAKEAKNGVEAKEGEEEAATEPEPVQEEVVPEPEPEDEGDELEALGDVVIGEEDAETHIKTLEKQFQTLPKFLSAYRNYTDFVPAAKKEPAAKHKKEPQFSNWAHAWRGLLDYILVSSDNREDVKVKKLLLMPLEEEMGPEPSGQPRIDMYPSDHLCIMAEVELCQK
ncbi:putative RNA exonuclease C9B6.11c [Yarrowia sp. C11]|nr:putative RNA exonuclease C9B6.11c [Yarrowia sp. E02]KAG5373360.1 putative RNA exonuclease C9B6.11c [Yarrowia sp. C11]